MPADQPLVRETATSEDCLDEVHALLHQLWEDAGDVSGADRMAFETAVAEVAANIVEHAARFEPVRLRVVLHHRADRLEAHFEDRGEPYAGQDVRPREVESGREPLAESGRGLAMASALADEVLYERDGPVNRWVVTRFRAG